MSTGLPERVVARQANLVLQLTGEVAEAVGRGTPADAALSAIYRRHREFGSRDRQLFSAALFAWFRWRGWAEEPAAPGARSCALSWWLDALPTHPAIERLAAAAGLPPGRPLAPDDTLALRAARLAERIGGPAPRIESLIPAWAVVALSADAGCPLDRDRLLEAFQCRPPTWIRLRPKAGDEVAAILGGAHISCTRHARLVDAVSIPGSSPLRALAPRLRGRMEVQDLASQAVGLICAPASGTRWWDMCCGSGGKALHLADLMAGQGEILATDLRSSSLRELARRAGDSRMKMIRAQVWNGEDGPAPGGPFDGVLLDAPCSGLGTWHRNPDARWRTSAADVERCVAIQARLLHACAQEVRPDGVLVYATCTLTAAENTEAVDRFLAAHGEYASDPFLNPLDGTITPGRLWIPPWAGPCNGMFVTRLKRSLSK